MTWAEFFDAIRRFAFGEMNMSPNDFYEMEIEDFILKSNGFKNARVREERIYRRLAEFTIAPYMEKGAPNIMSMWPITDDEILKAEQEQHKASRRRKQVAQLSERQKAWLKKAAENPTVNINPYYN